MQLKSMVRFPFGKKRAPRLTGGLTIAWGYLGSHGFSRL